MAKTLLAPATAVALIAVAATLVAFLPSDTATSAGTPHGDIDCDGDVDSLDALRVLQRSAGLVPPLTPCKPGPDPTPAATATPSLGASRENPVPRGTPYLVPEGWEITVLDFVPDATDLVLADPDGNPPDEGMRFTFVRIRITNISAGDPAFHQGGYAPRLVGSSQLAYTQFYAGCGIIANDIRSQPSDVFPGGTVEGIACFQVAVDETDLVMFTDFPVSDFQNWRWFALEG